MKPSVVLAFASRRIARARFAASKAADSHQAPAQLRETEAGVLAAWQQMRKGSESSRDGMLLSAVRSCQSDHRAATASVRSAHMV